MSSQFVSQGDLHYHKIRKTKILVPKNMPKFVAIVQHAIGEVTFRSIFHTKQLR